MEGKGFCGIGRVKKGVYKELAVQKPGVKNTEQHVFPTRGPLHNVASGITWKVGVEKKNTRHLDCGYTIRDRDKIVFQMREHPSCINALWLLFVCDLLCVNEPLALNYLCESIRPRKVRITQKTRHSCQRGREASSQAKFGSAPMGANSRNLWEDHPLW